MASVKVIISFALLAAVVCFSQAEEVPAPNVPQDAPVPVPAPAPAPLSAPEGDLSGVGPAGAGARTKKYALPVYPAAYAYGAYPAVYHAPAAAAIYPAATSYSYSYQRAYPYAYAAPAYSYYPYTYHL